MLLKTVVLEMAQQLPVWADRFYAVRARFWVRSFFWSVVGD